MERQTLSSKNPLGSKLPTFELPSVDGSQKGSDYLKQGKAALVAFTCNHCPYVKGSEESLIEIVRNFEKAGLRSVAISSNDAQQYPEDSFEKMVEKAAQLHLPYPYLYDQSQDVARLFDAECTPEFFLYNDNQQLVFHGTINDSPRDASKVSKQNLLPAIEQVLTGETPNPQFVHPIGCSIKWKR